MPTDSTKRSVSPAALLSRMLNERYELLELLSEGMLFATFRGLDSLQNRDVIVKTLLPQYADNAEILSSLQTGVGDVLALSHIGIARPFDVGTDKAKGVACFLVEEYVTGLDFAGADTSECSSGAFGCCRCTSQSCRGTTIRNRAQCSPRRCTPFAYFDRTRNAD